MKRSQLLLGLGAFGILVVGFLAIQLVPYGHDHSNPPVQSEPAWNSLQTRALAVRACYDCHSNETTWPWYSNIAPVSWLVQRDVNKGRHGLNFSEWVRRQRGSREAVEIVQEGEMPPWFYSIMHPNAQLTSEERALLAQGMQTTFGGRELGQARPGG